MSALQKFTLKDIESVTDHFADVNLIGEGFFGKNYKAQLSLPVSGELVDVAVRRLDQSFRLQELAFDKEISVLSNLKHDNLVSIVGYCYENGEMIIINKREDNGSLYRHLSSPNLTWMRRLQISVGVARALCYLHNGARRNYCIVHHNINSASILLDENWDAKLSGFEYSMRIPEGHMDIAYERLGLGTFKFDVFSFGIVLFELLCGTEAFTTKENKKFQAPLAIFHHENRKLHELVEPDLFSQMDLLSFNKFAETAYYCLKEQQALPNMEKVLIGLEEALKLQQKQNHDNLVGRSTIERERRVIFPDHCMLKLKKMETMRIQHKDILLATEKFASKNLIVSGGYGSVYKGKLHPVDNNRGYCFAIEGENECEVAIKRILNPHDEVAQEGFCAEIEMLSECKHSNIVTLLGFCVEDSALILVYDYAPNKSLADYILNKRNVHNDGWAQRIKICIGVAKGLSCLHTNEGDRLEIVHRDIKSANILLGKNLDAKIGDFGLSTFVSTNREQNTRYFTETAGTYVYMDPQYAREKKLKTKIDVYSFGVVLFELLCGRLAYDPIYVSKYSKGLANVACQHFDSGTIMEIVDPKLKDATMETIVSSVVGPNMESVNKFSDIAYQCLTKGQIHRPTMEVVIKELQKALFFQENRKDIYRIPLKVIDSVTENFSNKYINDVQGFWHIYKATLSHVNGSTTIFIKRLDTSYHGTEDAFSTETKILMEYKHENIIGHLGYCDEKNEKIIVYEDTSLESLNRYVEDDSLTWGKRINVCIDIASGLDFLHRGGVTEETVIHRDIKSSNILLDADMKAKIAGFGISKIRPRYQETVLKDNVAGTPAYIDPQYKQTGICCKECDIYSFGVVLFEILVGKLAYSPEFAVEGKDMASFVKRLYKEGNLDEMVFEGKEKIAPKSITIFQTIAIQCLSDTRDERPKLGEVLIQLYKALQIHNAHEIQENPKYIFRIPRTVIDSVTKNFSDKYFIQRVRFWSVYKVRFSHTTINVKRLDTSHQATDSAFSTETRIFMDYEHENIISYLGYCDEKNEKVIVYEDTALGSLDMHLEDDSLTWEKRIKICIDIASGLDFLHRGGVTEEMMVIHRDIKSSNILLDADMKAKIAGFGISKIRPRYQEMVLEDNILGTKTYIDPQYMQTRLSSKECDIYSFGVVLLEILVRKLSYSREFAEQDKDIASYVKRLDKEGNLDEMVFKGKEKIVRKSLTIFQTIAIQCLSDTRDERPKLGEVLIQLHKALAIQENGDSDQRPTTSKVVIQHSKPLELNEEEDDEIWESKLPKNYKEIVKLSQSVESWYSKRKSDLYQMFKHGILIQEGKVFLSLDDADKINEMIPSRLFSYKLQRSQKWRHIRKSRFSNVAMILGITDLKIHIQIKPQFLSPDVIYGAYLIFKFCDAKKTSSDPMYVNLKYRKGDKILSSYFATWRDDEWMMIELYRFLNHTDTNDFDVLIERFSRYYCRSDHAIYIEGIEFRAINKMNIEDIGILEESQQVFRTNTNMDHQLPTEYEEIFARSGKYEKLFEPSKMDGKKRYMLPAKEFLYGSSNVKLYTPEPSDQSRFPKVIELPSHQVFRIKWMIENQWLSPDTEYMCYLVFKLSDICRGLHCPVKVKNLVQRNSKETQTLYFRYPTPWNSQDFIQLPKQREDGWMEVKLWKFNSNYVDKNGRIHVNLKLICYEGTMSGLIVSGLEFRQA